MVGTVNCLVILGILTSGGTWATQSGRPASVGSPFSRHLVHQEPMRQASFALIVKDSTSAPNPGDYVVNCGLILWSYRPTSGTLESVKTVLQ